MAKYIVSGPNRVAGHAPGDTVDSGDLANVNIEHLIAAGHLAPYKAAKAEKPEPEPQPTPAIETEEN